MTKNIEFELTLRPVAAGQSDDTAGYFTLIEKPAPQLGSQRAVAVPAVQIRLPLPDLRPEQAIHFMRKSGELKALDS